MISNSPKTSEKQFFIEKGVLEFDSQTALYEVDCINNGIYENRYYGTDKTCHFEKPGEHQIAMREEIPNLQLHDGDHYYLKKVDQWGSM